MQPRISLWKIFAVEKAVGLRVAIANDADFVDDEHAIIHVANDQLIDLLEIREIDPALHGELFTGAVEVAEQHPETGDDEIGEALPAHRQQHRSIGRTRRLQVDRDAHQRGCGDPWKHE